MSNRAPPPVPRRRNPHPPSSSVREISIRDLEPTGPPDRTYKVVFAGDAAVGKTSFINRLTKGHFVSNLASTLGVDFQVKTIRVDERNIAIQGRTQINDARCSYSNITTQSNTLEQTTAILRSSNESLTDTDRKRVNSTCSCGIRPGKSGSDPSPEVTFAERTASCCCMT